MVKLAKKKHHHEEHVDESWLIPYADIMTLLLALFIVLFASSSTDAEKLKQMSEVFREAFVGGEGILEYNSSSPMNDVPHTPILSDTEPEELAKTKQEEMENLEELQETLDAFIEEEGLSLTLKTQLTESGLLITISDRALFASGSAEVRPDAVALAKQISDLLVTNPSREIVISGHTDNVPINTTMFRSNWELSAIRSINFMSILLENANHKPVQFSATGHGEYRPVDTNESEKGKQNNRRVEVLILPNYSAIK